ncbi:MAG: hypothetical protein EOO48_03795 [Flavobacterium sp.]|nr:MAG: hypothetical protein EOO48_03795 [Flavobacterium sp.]
MKQIILSIAVCALMLTGCKKETITIKTADETTGDTTEIKTETVTVADGPWDARVQVAENNYNDATAKLKEAIAKGDKKAQEAAKKTADEAKSAWEKLRAEVRESTEKAKEDLKDAKQDAKEGYNDALEKAKAK